MDRRDVIAQLPRVLDLAESSGAFSTFKDVGVGPQLWFRALLVQDLLAAQGHRLSMYCTSIVLNATSSHRVPGVPPPTMEVPALGEVVSMEIADQSPRTAISIVVGPFGEPSRRVLSKAMSFIAASGASLEKPLPSSVVWEPASNDLLVGLIRARGGYEDALVHASAFMGQALLDCATPGLAGRPRARL